MKKILALTSAILIFTAFAAHAIAQDISGILPQVSNAEFTISLSDRTLEVAFDYSGVAGNFEDAKIFVIISAKRLLSGTTRNIIKLNIARSAPGAGVPWNTINQGRKRYQINLPDTVKINELHEISEVGVILIDSLGRQSQSNSIMEVNIEKKSGI